MKRYKRKVTTTLLDVCSIAATVVVIGTIIGVFILQPLWLEVLAKHLVIG